MESINLPDLPYPKNSHSPSTIMKQFRVILLFILVTYCAISNAQQLKVVKATIQQWSGGMPGHYGTNYNIELETKSKSLKIDTIWINHFFIVPDFSGKNFSFKRNVDSVSHKITYAISTSESHDEYAERNRVPIKDTTNVKPLPARQFKGAALISYKFRSKQHFLTIPTFTGLEPINYP